MGAGERVPGGWIRKLGFMEKFMKNGADFDILTTLYTLEFESKQCIDMKVIEEACLIVAW